MVMLTLKEQPPLIQAIFGGEIEDVKNVLNTKVDVNDQDAFKRTPLHAAAFKGNKTLVELLLLLGARANAKDNMWLTPLHRACSVGAHEILNLLLDYKAEPNARDRQWQTPLHIAAANNAFECVEILIQHVNINVTDRLGRTALHHAALNGHNSVVELLLSKGSIINACDKKDCRPIHWAAYMGHVETTELLIRNRADINVKDSNQYTPLHVAASTGMTMVSRVLLNSGAEVDPPNAFGNTPLHVACLNGHLAVCHDLLYYNANLEAINYQGQTPLHIAAASTHGVGCLIFLLDNNVNINTQSLNGRTALHMSAIHGRFTRSKTLIDKGAVVDCPDKNGNTALHISAQYGHDILTSTLLEYGADPSKRGYEGRTALHVCCLSGHVEVCRKIIQAKIDLNTTDNTGKTAVHCAAYTGSVECLDLLVSQGATFKLADSFGRTALHYAAVRGHYDVVFTLVGIGAPVNVVDNEGCTPLHLSAAYDLEGKCVEYLLRHKADPKLKDNNGFTSVHYAVNGCNIKSLEFLLNALGKDFRFCGPDMPANTPLHLAARNGNVTILETIRPYFPDMNIKNDTGATPLLIAAREGHTASVQIFLRYGAKVGMCEDIYNMSPVHYSAKNGHIHCLALVVDNTEDKSIIDKPDKFNRTALMLAVSSSHGGCVLILLKSKADPNIVDNDGHSSLFRAVATDQKSVVQLLISQGAQLTLKDINGKTVLHLVSACGYLSCLQIILNNLKPEEAIVFDNKDFTPLHWGCYYGNAACVEYLLDSNIFTKIEGNVFSPVHCAAFVGSERCLELLYNKFGNEIVKLEDAKKRLSLHIAALQGHMECARYLLEQGADINAEDETGRTTLVAAAQNGQSQIIELLIAYKADVKSSDNNGNTALHVACLKRHSHTALLLLEYINKEEIINMVNNDKKTALHLAARNGLVDVTKNLIRKGSSVLAVDSNGLTPALCCAPNQSVAQCLALILANHPLRYASNHSNKELIQTLHKPCKNLVISKCSSQIQTDLSYVRDSENFNEKVSKMETKKKQLRITKSRKPQQNRSSPCIFSVGSETKNNFHSKDSKNFKITLVENYDACNDITDRKETPGCGLDLHRSFSEMSLTPFKRADNYLQGEEIISWQNILVECTNASKTCFVPNDTVSNSITKGAISKHWLMESINYYNNSDRKHCLNKINIFTDPKFKCYNEAFKLLNIKNLNVEQDKFNLYLPLNEMKALKYHKKNCDCLYVCEKCITKNMFDADYEYVAENDNSKVNYTNAEKHRFVEIKGTLGTCEMLRYIFYEPNVMFRSLIFEYQLESIKECKYFESDNKKQETKECYESRTDDGSFTLENNSKTSCFDKNTGKEKIENPENGMSAFSNVKLDVSEETIKSSFLKMVEEKSNHDNNNNCVRISNSYESFLQHNEETQCDNPTTRELFISSNGLEFYSVDNINSQNDSDNELY